MLNNNSKMAVRAVLFLAAKNDMKIGIKEMALQLNENPHTVGKVLQRLVRKKLIHSVKGPSGGFFMDRQQQEHSLIDIIDAMEGGKTFETCILGLQECSDEYPCPIHGDYKIIREQLETLFRNKQIKTISDPEKIEFLNLMR